MERFDNVSVCLPPNCGPKLNEIPMGVGSENGMKLSINNFGIYDCKKDKDGNNVGKCIDNLLTRSNTGGATIHNRGKIGINSHLYTNAFNKKYNKIFINCPSGAVPYDTVEFGDNDVLAGNKTKIGACVKDSDIDNLCRANHDPIGSSNPSFGYALENDKSTTECSNINEKVYLTNINPPLNSEKYLVNTPSPTQYNNFKDCSTWCEKDKNCAGVQHNIDDDGNVFCKYYNANNETLKKKIQDDANYITYNNIDTYVKKDHSYDPNAEIESFGDSTDGCKMVLSLLLIATLVYLLSKQRK